MATTSGAVAAAATPNLIGAADAAVATNIFGIISAQNLDPTLLSPALVLLSSRGGNSGGFGWEGCPLLSTIADG